MFGFDFSQLIPSHSGERLLFDIVLVLGMGVLLAMLAQKLKQSVIVGYILAGMLLGPNALNLVGEEGAFAFMADIGIALLLFTIGLELSWSSLRHDKRLSIKFGILQVFVTGLLAGTIFYIWGTDIAQTILLGMIVALSSTAAVLHLLTSRSEMDSIHGRVALSVLLIQDILTIFFLIIIPQLGGNQEVFEVFKATGIAGLKLIAVSIFLLIIERLFLRPLFKRAAKNPESETLVLLATSVALGVSGLTATLGLSPALGAFLVGLLLGDTPYSDQIRAEIGPLRIGMLVLFFAYVGMTVDLGWLWDNLLLVMVFSLGVIAFKTAVVTGILRFAKFTWRHAVLSGLAIAQLGEFSLVVAVLGREDKILDNFYFQLVVSTVLVTIIVTPALINFGVKVAHKRNTAGVDEVDDDKKANFTNHAVVVGFGPAGQEVAKDLVEQGILTVVIDLNLSSEDNITDKEIRKSKLFKFMHGDAARLEILQTANIEEAKFAIITIPDANVAAQMISQITSANPQMPIIVRCRHNRFLSKLQGTGATHVIDEETLTGEKMSQQVLAIAQELQTHQKQLEAPPENESNSI
jgi:CPA2 family monovalent cation:H+ antiporter-2